MFAVVTGWLLAQGLLGSQLPSIEILGRFSRSLCRGMLAGFGGGSGSAQSRSPVTEKCIWRGRNSTCSPWCCHHGRTTEQSELLCFGVTDEMQRPIRRFIVNGDQGLEEVNKYGRVQFATSSCLPRLGLFV